MTAQLDFLTTPEEVEFAMDSPLEGERFEPSVPRKRRIGLADKIQAIVDFDLDELRATDPPRG